MTVVAITPEDVAGWAKVNLDDDTSAQLVRIIAAVVGYMDHHYEARADDGSGVLVAGDVAMLKLGAIMQCARLFKRRSTPHGIEGALGDAAIYVSRFDPDVEEMLSPLRAWGFGA